MRKTLGALAVAMVAVLPSFGGTIVQGAESASGLRPMTPVDTSRVVGSPDPARPYRAEKAFPALRFERPLEITHAGDGSNRVFVVTQKGVIYVFPNRGDVAQNECRVFLDWSRVVRTDENEEGMMGLAFHLRFRKNGTLYVYYTTRPLQSVLARFRVLKNDPNRVDPKSFEILLNFPQPYWNHNGGSMEFGPDGYLYLGLGDGGAGGDPHRNGQNLKTLLGKILRIDVDRAEPGLKYAIPEDNPFADRTDGTRREIWAYGVRNIWRLSFDRKTGTLWAGDVGQDRYEEVDIIRKGGNYGWNLKEGLHDFRPDLATGDERLIDPIIDYDHTVGFSVTGGVVYRGNKLPALDGAYLYADYVSGRVWALRYDGHKVTSNIDILRRTPDITSFGQDEAGEVYFTCFDGCIYKLRERDAAAAEAQRPFPRKLSETGLFADTKTMAPTLGLIPYSVNVPLWSDGAAKERYLALPKAKSVKFGRQGQWQFPQGTVLVKSFFLDRIEGDPASRRRLETRLLVLGDQGWTGYTYLWNDAQSDAELLDGAVVRHYDIETPRGPVRQEWYYPSRSDCMVCHTDGAGHVLGLNARQLNRPQSYGTVEENQLRALDAMGVFEEPLPDDPEQLESYPDWNAVVSGNAATATSARAYLDVNCAICHCPGGTSDSSLDMRFHTPLEDSHMLGVAPAKGDYGHAGARIVAPGDPDQSLLLIRMKLRGRGQMPRLATSIADEKAAEIIEAWIRSLKTE